MAQEAVGAAIKHAEEQQTEAEENDGDAQEAEDEAKESGETMQWVVFTLNGEEYAAPGEQIREIVRVPEIVSVPQAPGFVEGAIALRGRILPVISLVRRFGLEQESANEDAKIIVADIHGVATGILVDGVRAVMDIADSDQQPAPAIVAGGSNIITGLAGLDDGKRIIMLIDVDHMLNAEESEVLKSVAENKPSAKAESKPKKTRARKSTAKAKD